MTMWGADPDGLDTLALQMAQAADALDRIRTKIGSRLHSVVWRGHSADAYRDTWSRRDNGALLSAAGQLREASAALRRNAVQQRSASAADAGTAGAGGAGIGRFGSLTHDGENVGVGAVLDAEVARLALSKGLADIAIDWSLLAKLPVQNFRVLDQVRIGPIDALVGAWDIGRLAQAIQAGDGGDVIVRRSINVAWDAASLYPPVGLAKTAFDAGYAIGTTAADTLEGHSHNQEAVLDDVVRDRYGGQLTTASANDLSHRYDGWTGFGHFLGDSESSAAARLRKLF